MTSVLAVYSRNRNGPRTDPCGSPYRTFVGCDDDLLYSGQTAAVVEIRREAAQYTAAKTVRPLETSQEHGMINDYDSRVVDQADQLVYMSACVALACYILSTSPVMSHLNPSTDSSHSVI